MRYLTLLFVLFLAPATAPELSAQDLGQRKAAIVAEGYQLYRLEQAAWNATDLVQEQSDSIIAAVGGYVTYVEGDFTHCTFYDQEEIPNVLVSLSFDSTFNPRAAVMDYSPRQLTKEELRLVTLRSVGIKALQRDTSVVMYKNTSLNFVPLVYEGVPKMYVLTGPKVSGVVVFGNDYLVTYNNDDQATSVRKLHNNIIPVDYEVDGKPTSATVHSHNKSTGALMTPTDICTLLLYGPFTEWETHQVMSEEYLNIWDLKKQSLVVITRKALKKIEKHQKKRGKKRKRNN